jgi:transposase
MRFVEVKSPEQQGVMVLHRTRQTLIRQRTQLSNVIRGHMAELGISPAEHPKTLANGGPSTHGAKRTHARPAFPRPACGVQGAGPAL